MQTVPLDSPEALAALGEERRAKLADDLEMLEVAGNPFSLDEFRAGKITPVFFGSAFTNFGIEPFYDAFVEMAPGPGVRQALRLADRTEVPLDPISAPFSAYVFKIQANMDPKHRDALAFMRICSGRFERDIVVKHVHRGAIVRELRLSRPATLVARDRTILDEAFPGDVVGLINAGFAIGDTLIAKQVSQQNAVEHLPLPAFPPECFARVSPSDLTKRKSFDKGMLQLASEGAVQVLRPWENPHAEPIIAAVGRLQFDVLQYRLRDEYGVETQLSPLPYTCSGWLVGDPATFEPTPSSLLARDARARPVVLFPSEWDRNYCFRQNRDHRYEEYA